MLKKYAAFIKLSALIDNEADYNRAVSEMSASAESSSGHSVNAKKIVLYNPDFVYARFKAIGCLEVDGPNANADAFPYPEFLDTRPGYGYRSFIGKHAYVEHASDNINNAIGDLYGAYLNRFNTTEFDNREWIQLGDNERMIVLASRKPHEDGSIEVLMAVDRKAAPRIARMIDTDSPTGCSMGTNIEHSECTVCGNRAYVEEQYCPHIRFSKGQSLLVPAQQIHNLLKKGTLRPEWLPFVLSRKEDLKAVKTASRKMVYAKAFEINYGLSFFELSVVGNPAFHRGYKLEKIAQMTKPSFKQLKPRVFVDNHPVEVIFNVTDDFYNGLLNSYAQTLNSPVENWTEEEKLLFDRDGEIAKAALQSNNVLEVLANKSQAPYFVKSDIDLVPSNDAGFYNITNPEELLSKTFAGTKSRKVAGIIGAKTENLYACAICKGIFNRNTHKKVIGELTSFDKFSICSECEINSNNNKGDLDVAKNKKNVTDVQASSTVKKTAEYESLPSTADFTGDKEPTEGDSRKGETALYKDWAEKGSHQIEEEKKYRPMGTIFIDAIVAKKSLSDRASRIKELKQSVNTLLKRVKLAIDAPEDFLKEENLGRGQGPGKGLGKPFIDQDDQNVESEIEGIAIAIELEPEDVPTVLENTKKDLELIKEDLEQVSEIVGGKEKEALDALARKIRWARRNAFGAVKVAEDADTVIEDAVSAIEDAITKLDKAYDIYSTEESDETVEKEKNITDNNKESGDSEGESDMSKEARLEITEANIGLLQKLAGVVNSSQSQKFAAEDKEEKKEEKAEKEEEKAEKEEEKAEKEEEKAEKEEKADEKKAEKEAAVKKSEKTADTKEAAAMPPTGARDPGDYGEPGAVESVEMNAWWQQMYPEYEKMKAEERRKSLNDPETKVELLTGALDGGEDASTDKRPGEAPKGPTVYSGAIIVKKFANAWEPRKTFYGVVKVAENGVENAFTANFGDVAGDDGGSEEFGTFTSDAYATEIVNTVKELGSEATRKMMNGKIAQLEGITPGKTSKTPQALYDTQESEKHSNEPRKSMRPDSEEGHGKADEGNYYGKAFGDEGYASALKNAKTKIATLQAKVNDLELEKKSDAVAKRALHLARIAASRGICPFDLQGIEKQAMEYIQLDDRGLSAVKAHLEKLPVVNQRALEAYQIPEAEDMGAGVVHNRYTSVRDVRYEGGEGEDVAPEGIQNSVHENAKISAEQQANLRKRAQEVVPQLHTNDATGQGNGIPDVTKYFNTIENRLRRVGKFEQFKHLLRSNRH